MHNSQLQYDLAEPKGWDVITTHEEVAFNSLTKEEQALVIEAIHDLGCSIDEALKELKSIQAI